MTTLYEWLIFPFTIDFMFEALWVGCFAALCCAVLSAFIVNKGWSLVGDAVSHAVLPGIILAWMAAIPMMIGAMISGVLCVLLAGTIDDRSRVKPDAVLGICYTGFLALGLVLMASVISDVHFSHILLGNLLGVTDEARIQLLLAGGIAFACLLLRYRDLKLYCFDVTQARAIGLCPDFMRLLLLGCLALTTVSVLQAVGLIQVIALLVTPGCIGLLLSRRFTIGMLWGALASVISVWAGLVISFHSDLSPGPCIVLTQFGCFVIAMVLSPHRGGVLAKICKHNKVKREESVIVSSI